jgi:hypothetical protein
MARTGRPRKYDEGLAERVTVSIDPSLRRRMKEAGVELHDALTEGAKLLLDPQLLEITAVNLEQRAAYLHKQRQVRIEEVEIQETLQRAQPFIVEFLRSHGRQLGADFWKTGSPHFDRFQRTLAEWESVPEIATRLREAAVPQEALQKLVVLHLAK